jgi:hypothetical protein
MRLWGDAVDLVTLDCAKCEVEINNGHGTFCLLFVNFKRVIIHQQNPKKRAGRFYVRRSSSLRREFLYAAASLLDKMPKNFTMVTSSGLVGQDMTCGTS